MKGGSDCIPIGGSVRLGGVSVLGDELGITPAEAIALLRGLNVPVFYPASPASPASPVHSAHSVHRAYFNLPSLELVLYALLRPGGPGWRSDIPNPEYVRELNQLDILGEMDTLTRMYGGMDRQLLRERCREAGNRLRKALRKLVLKDRRG